MAARGQLHAVVALTGGQAADRDALAIRNALAPVPVTAGPPFPAPARAQTRALPDAEEEARYAVRRIFPSLRSGRAPAWTASLDADQPAVRRVRRRTQPAGRYLAHKRLRLPARARTARVVCGPGLCHAPIGLDHRGGPGRLRPGMPATRPRPRRGPRLHQIHEALPQVAPGRRYRPRRYLARAATATTSEGA